MDKKRIGINYNYSSSWIGGKYYLDSIINVLKENPENEIIYLKRPFILRCLGKILGKNSGLYKNGYKKENAKLNLDVVFPFAFQSFIAKKNISWIPDFQENYYPEFFSVDEILKRLEEQTRVAYSDNVLILSSESAKNDFERLFPKHTCDVHVLSFVSSLTGGNYNTNSNVLNLYNIRKPFFICSNQLWKHKNHIVVINAIKKLKNEGISVSCVFTGKEEDFRNPKYPDYLKNIVNEYNLNEEIKFLGFIPRVDQIELMKQSIAVIQPSLFEGWNTTIEDAKLCNKKVIASSISVHKEQLGVDGIYFNVDDYEHLAAILKSIDENNIECNYEYNNQIKVYKQNVKSFFE